MDFIRQLQSSEYGTLEVAQVRVTGIAAGATINVTYTPPKNHWIIWLEFRQGNITYDKFTMSSVLDNVKYPAFYLGMETDYPLPFYTVKPCREKTVFTFTNTDAVPQDLLVTFVGILVPFTKLGEWKERFGIQAWMGERETRTKELEHLAEISRKIERPKEVVKE